MGTIWVNLDYLKRATGYKDTRTLKKKILIPYEEEISKFSYYPKTQGEKWRFSKKHLDAWLTKNVC